MYPAGFCQISKICQYRKFPFELIPLTPNLFSTCLSSGFSIQTSNIFPHSILPHHFSSRSWRMINEKCCRIFMSFDGESFLWAPKLPCDNKRAFRKNLFLLITKLYYCGRAADCFKQSLTSHRTIMEILLLIGLFFRSNPSILSLRMSQWFIHCH